MANLTRDERYVRKQESRTLVPSTQYKADDASAVQSSDYTLNAALGAVFYVNVSESSLSGSASPSRTKHVVFSLEGKDSISGNYVTLPGTTRTIDTVTTVAILCYPGAAELSSTGGAMWVRSLPMPAVVRTNVTLFGSATGSAVNAECVTTFSVHVDPLR